MVDERGTRREYKNGGSKPACALLLGYFATIIIDIAGLRARTVGTLDEVPRLTASALPCFGTYVIVYGFLLRELRFSAKTRRISPILFPVG